MDALHLMLMRPAEKKKKNSIIASHYFDSSFVWIDGVLREHFKGTWRLEKPVQCHSSYYSIMGECESRVHIRGGQLAEKFILFIGKS